MDGNGRWAQKQNKERTVGHYYGSENVRQIALESLELGIEVITLYAFSTENWKRPAKEIEYLMKLPAVFFKKFLKELNEKGIQIQTIGDLNRIPEKTRLVMLDAIEQTKNNTKLKYSLKVSCDNCDHSTEFTSNQAARALHLNINKSNWRKSENLR